MNPFAAVIIAGLTPFIVLGLLVTGLSLGLVLWQPPVQWTVEFGNVMTGVENQVTAVSGDSTGMYAAGYVGSAALYLHAPPGYLFLTKYDFNGQQVWTQHPAEDLTLSRVTGIGVGSDGAFVAGELNGTAFVEKYDPNGKQVWSAQPPSLDGTVSTMSIGANSVLVGGLGRPNGTGTSPIVVSNYAHNGSLVWTRSLGNETGTSSNQVSIFAGNDGFYVAGADGLSIGLTDSNAFLAKYDLNGSLLWRQSFGTPSSICACSPAMISGDSTAVYVASYDLNIGGFIVKYSPAGDMLWKSHADAPDHAGVKTLRISTGAKGPYLAMTTGYPHGFVMSYDSNGNQLWSVRIDHAPDAVWAGPRATYVGGTSLSDSTFAFVSAINQSSSLVFFGLNPPLSFVLLGLLIGVVGASLWALRRFKGKRIRPRSTTHTGGMKVPTDLTKTTIRMLRPVSCTRQR